MNKTENQFVQSWSRSIATASAPRAGLAIARDRIGSSEELRKNVSDPARLMKTVASAAKAINPSLEL